MTLIAKQGRGTYATSRTYRVQDKAALAQLQQRYAAMVGPRTPRHCWTQAETVELGRLYRQAYGLAPTSNRNLLDFNMETIDPTGCAHIAFADDNTVNMLRVANQTADCIRPS